MNHDDLKLHACSYSYHIRPFRTSYTPPPFYLLRLQVVGCCQAWVEGRMERIEPGDLLMYRPGEVYHLQVGEEPETWTESGDYFLFCEGSWVEQWWETCARTTKRRIHLDEGVLSLWQQLCMEQHRVPEPSPELINHLLCALLLSVDRVYTSSQTLSPRSGKPNQNVSLMKSHIHKHALGSLRVEEVADAAGLSVSRAVHLFKENTGYTIIQYTQEIRLSYALERILYTELTFENIAYSCGFATYSYFHKVFKSKYGLTPKAMRNQPASPRSGVPRVMNNVSISGMTSDAQRFLLS